MARDLNVERYTWMILTASFAIPLGSVLYLLTGADGIIAVAAVLLAVGLVAAWIADRRRKASSISEGTISRRAGLGLLSQDPVVPKQS